jgi:tetratricopeptide (TPR) repeat protein
MKREFILKFIASLTSVILACSCSEDFLDQKPISSLTELTYYKNIPELESGLVACYGSFTHWFSTELWIIEDIGSDDADKGSDNADQYPIFDISYSRQLATNNWIYTYWEDMYRIIARCNLVIDKSKGVKGDLVKIEMIVDQAKYLRALCYYHLVIEYGDIPFPTKFLNPSEVNIKRTAASDIWNQIIMDLQDASNLPTSSQWNLSGRVTSGAVFSLLGKVFLTLKRYNEANAAFYKVVSSNEYQIVSDYGFNFRHEGENCSESVFEIQYKSDMPGGNVWSYNAAFRIPKDNEAGGWGFDCPTEDLLNEFEKGDPRIIYTFIFQGDKFPGIDPGSVYTAENSFSQTGYNARKAWIPWSERAGYNWIDWDINYRYMRYAEVLLLYAESLNEMNKPDSARMLVNMVRARARNTPVTDPQRISCAHDLSHSGPLLPDIITNNQSDLRLAIWHEQRVELAIEGHRRGLLLRTNRFKTCMEKAKASQGCTVEPHEWLLPIPFDEIAVSNGLLTQNPGY